MFDFSLPSFHAFRFTFGNNIEQKQYADLFALAAEDETSGVGRRGGSARGRRPPPNKKDTNSTNSNSKKNAEPINNVYSSDEQSSDVSMNNVKANIYVNHDSIDDKPSSGLASSNVITHY